VGTLLDTTVFIGLEREFSARDADDAVVEVLERLVRELGPDEQVGISVITASELLHGVHRATDPEVLARRDAFVEAVIEAFPPISFDLRCGRAHARLWAHLAAGGIDIGAHDRVVAATALAIGWRVATANVRHYHGIPGLEVVAPDFSA
jgi:tRNA(fMet)-specific endonuclease VapC